MARAAALAMTTLKRGHIVMIGSVSGITPSVASSLYNAAKFGVRGFTLGFRQDLDGTGVGISLVEPGLVRDAGMFAESGGKLPKGVRTVTPEDVFGSVFPAFNAKVQAMGGGDEVAGSIVEGQRDKR